MERAGERTPSDCTSGTSGTCVPSVLSVICGCACSVVTGGASGGTVTTMRSAVATGVAAAVATGMAAAVATGMAAGSDRRATSEVIAAPP